MAHSKRLETVRFFHLDGSYCQELVPWEKMLFNPDACMPHSFNRYTEHTYSVLGKFLDQELANFFCKGPDSKYIKFCEPYVISAICSCFFSNPLKYKKQFLVWESSKNKLQTIVC